jgi:hypothetical protein
MGGKHACQWQTMQVMICKQRTASGAKDEPKKAMELLWRTAGLDFVSRTASKKKHRNLVKWHQRAHRRAVADVISRESSCGRRIDKRNSM